MGTGGADFVGRERELTRLATLTAKVRAGEPQVVWVRGAAGIGKTTMVRRFAAQLTEFTVLVANADPAETALDHGVVGQLVRRLPDAPVAGPHESPLAVGARLLDVLDRLQTDGSVAMVVDDAQWADQPSIQALGFVLCRIWADQVLVVVVSRWARPPAIRRGRPGEVAAPPSGVGPRSRDPTHPTELAYPCCLPALGRFTR